MSSQDQTIVLSLPGNNKCAECDIKSPQWASVSFGTVLCLECAGIHRSLGVHISFVRSMAMDSWSPKQLAIMKTGGNTKCASYLTSKGVNASTPLKPKYESPAAQLYKEILKARVEGRPEPTELPKPKVRTGGTHFAGSIGKGGADANGMERLSGETDEQYIARQNRLKEEARKRMASKFGGSGGLGGSMGGVGSGGSRMSGIGSNPNYNPHSGYGGGPGGVDMDGLVAGFGSALSSFGSVAKVAASSAANSAQSMMSDKETQRQLQNMSSSIATTGGSIWNTFSTSVTSVAASLSQPDGLDGLNDFNQQMSSQRTASGSKYSGFGSDTMSAGGMPNNGANYGGASPASALQEAPGAPGEDRNGIERLTGESDEQYVLRQTRLRDEAKARMAAKFGGGSLSSASSSLPTASATSSIAFAQNKVTAPSSGNGYNNITAPSSGNFGGGVRSAPTSGNWNEKVKPKPAVKLDVDANDDFFASFGT